jgi:RNA polymerase sigma-70 factor (ECF subfamily)
VADLAKRIVREVPRLRRYARALTRNSAAVDDLVQECVERALTRQHLWEEGTNLTSWLFTIVHNQYVNQVRYAALRGAPISISDAEPFLLRPGGQEARHTFRDFNRALAQLPDHQRRVILLIGVEGISYQRAAAVMGCRIGTVRSRLFRAREALHHLMGFSLDEFVTEPKLPSTTPVNAKGIPHDPTGTASTNGRAKTQHPSRSRADGTRTRGEGLRDGAFMPR